MNLTLTPNTEASAAGPNFFVMHGPLRVGRIRREDALKPGCQWIWVATMYDGPDAKRRSGVAATIEEAQAAIKDSWQHWLAWAGLSERDQVADESSRAPGEDNKDDELIAAVLREAHLAARG